MNRSIPHGRSAAHEALHVPSAVNGPSRARELLARLVADRVEADGAVRDRCASRILESALLLQLLRGQGTLPQVQDRLGDYLRHAPQRTFLDTAIADGVQGRQDIPAVRAYLEQFHHFTGARKRLMIRSLLALCDAAPLPPVPELEQIRYGDQALWTDLALCAVRILGAGPHDTSAPAEADRAFLTQQLTSFGPDQVWQGNLLNHLIALHALRSFHPGSPLLAAGIQTLARHSNPDGGVPFIAGQEVWVTSLAGTALVNAGAPHRLALRMGDYIAGRQLEDGGWGYDHTTTQSDVDDTSRCMTFLQHTDPHRYRHALHQAENYLLGIANPDSGGFPTYRKGHPSEPDLTAGAVIALAPTGHRHLAVLSAALRFLRTAQRDDGTFERSWTMSESSVISHVWEAFEHTRALLPELAPPDVPAGARLIATQNSDGGWGQAPGQESDALSTAHALPAVRAWCGPEAAQRALDYLLSRQHDDGSYTAPPDQVGPRPIPYDFPLLTQISVLTGLNHVLGSHVAPSTARLG